MNIIDKIENSEVLGYLTFLIDEIEKDINETEKNISLMYKKYINKQLIINLRINDNFSKFAKAMNSSTLKLKDLSNAMLKLGEAMSNNMLCSSLYNSYPFIKEMVKLNIKKEEEMIKCLMS